MSKVLRTDYKPFSLNPNDVHPNHQFKSFGDYFQWFFQQFEEFFIKFIPFPGFREYPPRFMYPSGLILIALIVACWATIFGFLFYAESSNTYLSPADNPPAYSGATCKDVLVSNTGSYLATRQGLWEGRSGFDYADAAYSLATSSWKMDHDYYTKAMNSLHDYLVYVGEETSKSDLSWNLLYWFSFIALADPTDFANRVTLVGDPSIAFNRQNIVGTISSVHGECQLADQITTFDKANGILSLSIPSIDYNNSSNCLAAGNPIYLGYNKFITGNNFKINLDIFSLVTALAVNLNILTFDALIEVKAFRSNITFTDGSVVLTSRYFNPKFPGMAPIVCVVNIYCFLQVGPASYAVPFFHHIGNNTELPEPCDCNQMSKVNKADPYHQCNRFLFLTGFYFYPYNGIEPLEQFFRRNATTSHALSYYPAFAASAFGQASPNYSHFQDPKIREEMYRFCQTSYANCTMITFSLYDVLNPDWSISDHYYQLLTGACQDQVTASDESWQALIDDPFSSLTADYQECADNLIFIFFSQLGSALGTLDIIIPLAIVFTLFLLAIYQYVTGDKIPETYSREERESALTAFATTLLLARDARRVEETSLSNRFSNNTSNNYNHNNDSYEENKNERTAEIIENIILALDKDSSYHGDAYQLKNKVIELQNYIDSIDLPYRQQKTIVAQISPEGL